jgi:hypothetical protein
MFGSILLILEGAEKAIPLGLVALDEIQKLVALLKPAPNPDGSLPTQEETLAAVADAVTVWTAIKKAAEDEIAK